MMNVKDLEHLKWLSIFHFISAVLSLLFFGLVIVQSYGEFKEAKEIAIKNNNPSIADTIGIVMIGFTVIYLLIEIFRNFCTIVAGYFIRQRKHRIFCIVVAGVNCAFFPLGTVLGVFTLVVLFRESVKNMFTANLEI